LCAANTAAIKVFVGNKIDLREGQDILAGNSDAPINSETARKVFEEEMKCRYFECSALTRKGIPELFESSVREAIGVRLKEKNERSKVKSGVVSEQCCQLI
jgi:GTPase SAR1 family protein